MNLYELLLEDDNLKHFCDDLGYRNNSISRDVYRYLDDSDAFEEMLGIIERGTSDLWILNDHREIVYNHERYDYEEIEQFYEPGLAPDDVNKIIKDSLSAITVTIFDKFTDYLNEWDLSFLEKEDIPIYYSSEPESSEKFVQSVISDIKDYIGRSVVGFGYDYYDDIFEQRANLHYIYSKIGYVVDGETYISLMNAGETKEICLIGDTNTAYFGFGRSRVHSLNLISTNEYGSGEGICQIDLLSPAVFEYNTKDEAKVYTLTEAEEEILSFEQLLKSELGMLGGKLKKIPRPDSTTHNLQIKDPVLYNLSFELTKLGYGVESFIDIKTLKKLSKENIRIAKSLLKQSGNNFLRSHPNGFTVSEIIKSSHKKTSPISNQSITIDNDFVHSCVVGKDLLYGFDTWTGAQRYHKDLTNYVFRLDFNKKITDALIGKADTSEYTISDDNRSVVTNHRQNLIAYMKNSNHPTNTSGLLTFGWVRYTIVGDVVVLDEIQSDLDNKDMIPNIMSGWEDILMKAFIDYVRNKLGYRIIKMPTYKTKINDYYANPPMRLYKELPNRFGFEKIDDNWMVLESTFKNYIANLLK